MVKTTKKKTKPISSKEFDTKFNNNEDITEHLILENTTKKILIDFPIKALKSIDEFSNEIGIARTALIKIWLHERVQQEKDKKQKLA